MTQLSAARNTPDGSKALYGGKGTRRITVRDLALAKERGEKWPMLTAYDAMTASVFDEAGIPVLLVGDSAGNCHLGYETTVPVTMDEMTMLSGAVGRRTRRALPRPVPRSTAATRAASPALTADVPRPGPSGIREAPAGITEGRSAISVPSCSNG